MITLFASNDLDLNKTSSAFAEMGDRLATIYMRQKLVGWGTVPLTIGSWISM